MRTIFGYSVLIIFCLCLAHSVHAQATHDPGKILVYGAGNVILPLFHGHPVKRFNSLSEVIHEAEDRREADPATLQR